MDKELKTQVDEATDPLLRSFEAFKEVNDQRLAEIDKRGEATADTLAKLEKIEATLDAFEGLNTEVAKSVAATQATAQSYKDVSDRLDEIEARSKRPGSAGAGADAMDHSLRERRERCETWARAIASTKGESLLHLTEEQRQAMSDVAAETAAWVERKNLATGNDAQGGYLAPADYSNEIVKTVTEISHARAICRVQDTSAKMLEVPIRRGQFAAMRVAELDDSRANSTGLTYGLESIPVPEMIAFVNVTNNNLEDSMFSVSDQLRMEAAEQFAVKEGQEFVTGDGVVGLEGILSNRDVGTINSGDADEITSDSLIQLKYELKTDYYSGMSGGMGTAYYIMNRRTMGKVRRLKGTDGHYLLVMGLAMGNPNTIEGEMYMEIPDMPDEAANARPVAFGNFYRGYRIADGVGMHLLIDPYTRASQGQVRFLFRRRCGGQVVIPEAIHTITCAV